MSEINKDMEVVCLSSITMKIAGEISLCVCARQGDQGPSHISRIQMYLGGLRTILTDMSPLYSEPLANHFNILEWTMYVDIPSFKSQVH